MSKRARKPAKVSIPHATRLAGHLTAVQQVGKQQRPGTEFHVLGQAAAKVQALWDQEPVVLQADNDFLDALLASDTDVPLDTGWLDRLPYGVIALALTEPLSLFDGNVTCHYLGFYAHGLDGGAAAHSSVGPRGVPLTYTSLQAGQAVRFLWLYVADGDPTPRAQTVSLQLKTLAGQQALSLGETIASQRALLESTGLPHGQELNSLYLASLMLLVYLSATEPDLDVLAPDTISRPQQLGRATVGNLGWRVGAALRDYTRAVTGAFDGPSGRTVAPHIRRAHFTRVRIATRDETGMVVGDRLGTQNVDWHYELRWIPPVPVGVGDRDSRAVVAPTVRPVA